MPFGTTRHSLSRDAAVVTDEKKLPFVHDGETSVDVEEGVVAPAYDEDGPIEFDEKKVLK